LIEEKTKPKQQLKQRFADPYSDSGIEVIDLSKLDGISSSEERELLDLNKRHPPTLAYYPFSDKWVFYTIDGSVAGIYEAPGPRTVFDKSKSRELPSYKNLAGQRVTPTRINSLLTQNPGDTYRPSSSFFWWKQTDESYYIAKAKEGLAEFIAETRENYYLVDENSTHRLKFRCPKIGKGDKEQGRLGDCDEDEADDVDFNKYGVSWTDYPLLMDIGPILIHVDPDSDQARWICPRCSKANSKKYRGDGKAIKHNVPRDLRDALAKDGVIPPKVYKYKDRLAEAPKLLALITKNPGVSFYELDHAMGWDSDGKNSERIIMKHLKDKVDLRRGRKGHKGYKVYIKH